MKSGNKGNMKREKVPVKVRLGGRMETGTLVEGSGHWKGRVWGHCTHETQSLITLSFLIHSDKKTKKKKRKKKKEKWDHT